MSSAMEFSRAEQSHIIGLLPEPHEFRNKLFGRKTTETSVLWWYDDEETTNRFRQSSLIIKAPERCPHSRRGSGDGAECLPEAELRELAAKRAILPEWLAKIVSEELVSDG